MEFQHCQQLNSLSDCKNFLFLQFTHQELLSRMHMEISQSVFDPGRLFKPESIFQQVFSAMMSLCSFRDISSPNFPTRSCPLFRIADRISLKYIPERGCFFPLLNRNVNPKWYVTYCWDWNPLCIYLAILCAKRWFNLFVLKIKTNKFCCRSKMIFEQY